MADMVLSSAPRSWDEVMGEYSANTSVAEIGSGSVASDPASFLGWATEKISDMASWGEKLNGTLTEFNELFRMVVPKPSGSEGGLSGADVLASVVVMIPLVVCGLGAIGAGLEWAYDRVITRIERAKFFGEFESFSGFDFR